MLEKTTRAGLRTIRCNPYDSSGDDEDPSRQPMGADGGRRPLRHLPGGLRPPPCRPIQSMMRSLGLALMVAAFAFDARPAPAQSLGASVHVGTLGAGARVAYSLDEVWNLRGGVDVQPIDIEASVSDVDFSVELPSPAWWVLVDWHPGGGSFRLSGGAVHFGRPLAIEGTPTEEWELEDNEYTASEVGTIRGSLGTQERGPYVGLGVGNAAGSGLGFVLDLGIVAHGPPDFSFEVTGPISSDPQFRSDLEAEAESINDDMPGFAQVYPILNLGFSFGF